MKVTPYRNDINSVRLEGVVHNMPEHIRYVPEPLIAFDVHAQRPRRKTTQKVRVDEIRVVMFGEKAEEFFENVKEGQTVGVKGEIQSRNFNIPDDDVANIYKTAVANYMNLMDEFPTDVEPSGKKKQPVSWKKILDFGNGTLLPGIPKDSMFDEEMVKQKSEETPYVYMVDEDGEVTKETEHVAYEVLAHEYWEVHKKMDELRGHLNAVILCGKITRNLRMNMLGNPPVPFANVQLKTASDVNKGFFYYPHASGWGKKAEEMIGNLKKGDYVFLKGRIQHRDYVKVFRKRWTTEGGNRKHKDVEIPLKARDVSISYVEKRTEKKKNQKEGQKL